MSEPTDTRYSAAEELANCITHGAGALLAAVGFAVLVVEAVRHGTPCIWSARSSSASRCSLSTPAPRSTMRSAIPGASASCAGGSCGDLPADRRTYTPFCLVTLRGPWAGRCSDSSGVWRASASAARARCGGAGSGCRWPVHPHGLGGRGGDQAALRGAAARGIVLLFAGGLAYTLGTVFYLTRRIPFNHALWHVAVLAGSVLHYFAVLIYVIRRD